MRNEPSDRRLKQFAASLAFGAISLACATAAHSESTVIVNVAVIDVEKGDVLASRDVTIDGEKITRIAATGDKIGEGAKTIDGKGKFLIPGLVDAHVHYISAGAYGPLMIGHGVTLVREMGHFYMQIFALRDALNSGEILGPEMIAVGAILDGDPPVWPFSEKCTTADEGRAAVRKMADAGANQIKVYSRLPREAYFAIVEEAHRRGLKAVGHVPGDVTFDEVIAAGQDSIEHMQGLETVVSAYAPPDDSIRKHHEFDHISEWNLLPKADRGRIREHLKKLAKSGTVQCPTLAVIKGVGRMSEEGWEKDPMIDYVPRMARAFWIGGNYQRWSDEAKACLPYLIEMVGELHRAGVPLICGTDLANPNVFAGHSLHDEMEMFVAGGVPPLDALRSATLTPVRFFSLEERLGTVAEGKTASLVLLDANPLDDIRNTRKIAGVFLKGRYFDRTELDRMVAEVRERNRPSEQKPQGDSADPPGE